MLVCHRYDTQPVLQQQRLRRGTPQFTDQELVTIYLFGHLQGFFAMRQSYDHIRQHWHRWFPPLPSYQAFNQRLNNLAPAFELLIEAGLQPAHMPLSVAADRVLDSLPSILAHGARATNARGARAIADKTFCASKNLW